MDVEIREDRGRPDREKGGTRRVAGFQAGILGQRHGGSVRYRFQTLLSPVGTKDVQPEPTTASLPAQHRPVGRRGVSALRAATRVRAEGR